MRDVLKEYQKRFESENVVGTTDWINALSWEEYKPVKEELKKITPENSIGFTLRQRTIVLILEEHFRGMISQKGAHFDLSELDDESLAELQAFYRMSEPAKRYEEIRRSIRSPESFLTGIPYSVIRELYNRGRVPFDREIFAASLIRFNVWHGAQYSKEFKGSGKERFDSIFPKDSFTLDILMAVFEMELGVDSAYYIERELNIGAVIIELVNSGYIDRSDIQQKLFEAFNNPTLKQTTHGWAKNVYRDLEFSLEENLACQEQLIELLHNDRNLLVNFGISELKKITNEESFNWQLFIESLDGIVYRDKLTGGIKTIITLLLKQFKKDKSLLRSCCIELAPLFLQEDAKIQIAASKCYALLKERDDEISEALTPYLDTICSEVKTELAHLIDSSDEECDYLEYEQALYGFPCSEENRISYIETSEDFLYLTSRVLKSDKALDYELFLEGILRFSSIRDSEKKGLRPALKQAKKLIDAPFFDFNAKNGKHHYAAALLIILWLDHEYPSICDLKDKWKKVEKKKNNQRCLALQWLDILTSFPRIEFISLMLKSDKKLSLLSTPTHDNFEIDPAVLLQRLKQYEDEGADINEDDFILALKRLNRSGDVDKKEINSLGKSEYREVLFYLLDKSDSSLKKRGTLSRSWFTAQMLKHPESAVDYVLKKEGGVTPWSWSLKRVYSEEYSWARLVLSYVDVDEFRTLGKPNFFDGGIADCEHWFSKNIFSTELFYIYYMTPWIAADLEAEDTKLLMSAVKYSALYLRPIHGAGYLLLTISLFCSNKAIRSGALEWLLLLIENRYLDIEQFTEAMTKAVANEYHPFPMNRVGEQFTQLLQMRGVHVTILRDILESIISELNSEKLPKSFNKILHIYHETLLLTARTAPENLEPVLKRMLELKPVKKEAQKILSIKS